MGSYNAWAVTSLAIDATEDEIAEEFVRLQERICWKENETRTYEAFCACWNRIPDQDAMRQHQNVADALWEKTVDELTKAEYFRENYKLFSPVCAYNYVSQETRSEWAKLKELLNLTIRSHALYLKGDPACSCRDGVRTRSGSDEEFCYRIEPIDENYSSMLFPNDGQEEKSGILRTCADLIRMRSTGLWYPIVDTIVRREATSLRKLGHNSTYYDELREESSYNYLNKIYGEMDWFFRLDYLLNAKRNANATVLNFVCVGG